VLPLSQGEAARTRENFAELLVSEPAALLEGPPARSVAREEYIDRAVRGGFPPALRRIRPADRARWFDDYVALVIERDVLELSRVRQRRQLPVLLRQLASQTGQVLNIAKAGAAIGMDSSTAENYTKLLEAVFVVVTLPAWGTTLGSRVAAAPKTHIVDSGLAARLLRLTPGRLAAATAPALSELGHLLESFVVGELCKQLDWLEQPVRRGHWRTHDGDEVDLIVEREDGKVAAIEIKAGSRVTGKELRGLRKLRRKLGSELIGGFVLNTGVHAYTHDDGVFVLPIARLWQG
jgi:hypothetical protein